MPDTKSGTTEKDGPSSDGILIAMGGVVALVFLLKFLIPITVGVTLAVLISLAIKVWS